MWFGISSLHDVGRVGAEHHQLAVRHVDDAHDAERDRQADGDQHQHRSEAQAEEQRLDAANRACAHDRSRARPPPRPCRTVSSVSTKLPSATCSSSARAGCALPARAGRASVAIASRRARRSAAVERGERQTGLDFRLHARHRSRRRPARAAARCSPRRASAASRVTAVEPHRRVRARRARSAPPPSSATRRRRLFVPILVRSSRGAGAGVLQRQRDRPGRAT